MMNRLSGTADLRKALDQGTPMIDFLKASEDALARYRQIREKYLLYE
jgi:hypothetical protein